MDRLLVGFALVTLSAYVAAFFHRPQLAGAGLATTAELFVQALPWLVVSTFAAGILSQTFSAEWIAQWLGEDAGLAGVLVGALLGMFGTGSRWALYPLAAGLLAAESSPGAVFSFVTTWQLVSLPRLPAELPFYGAEFTVVRAVVSVGVAILGGVVINRLLL
ncbi:hypothetical protein GCM10025857_37900 [Alicyclobacillus contaminans]|uniref:permease n=1 Tax=Alicyclobacillus contaminans TaxID=392016 RepID=UPI00040E2FC4|nr:permease [Alicyclobacillus contaminans]GMA52433.1 hypothetical protein GCM10025857_37900 [Alicyclobacillus contaminans]